MTEEVELQIGRWRDFIVANDAVTDGDADELEAHLREQIDELVDAGLSEDEAYLIAVKRLGSVNDLTREFAREHIGRLWKQLLPLSEPEEGANQHWLLALFCALGAAASIQIAWRVLDIESSPERFWMNIGLVVLPFLAIYFARTRDLGFQGWLLTAAPFALLAVLVNLYPFTEPSDTQVLVALHLPVVLWCAIGTAYMHGSWRDVGRRMDFVRFTGEWLIYFTLIVLGGSVLMTLSALLLEPLNSGAAETLVLEWLMPSGGAAAVVVATWLVEAKQRVIENMAPVLTWVFTPLFAVMLVLAVVVYALSGLGNTFDRDLLTVLDALLVVVLGMVIYGLSARETSSRPSLMDIIQLVAVVSALLLDIMVLGTMFARIEELGFTANRTAALGLNLLLFANLVVAAWLAFRFILKRAGFGRLTGWQLAFLPAFPIWAVIVVVAFPPLFGFN